MHKEIAVIYIGMAVLGACTFFALGYILRRYQAKKKLRGAEEKAKKVLEEAKAETEKIKAAAALEAKDQLLKMRTDFENQTKDRRQELLVLERRLVQKEENLDRKVDILDRKEKDIDRRLSEFGEREKAIRAKEKDLDMLLVEEKEKLQKVSGMTKEEARTMLLRRMEDEVKQDAANMIRRGEEEAKEKAEKEARKIIGLAIQRCAAEHTVETTVSVVHLPNDEMKGRIIGREGRNIRALEVATGIDVIIDDTPEAVILSGFDMVKREIAKTALERLIEDGRIHPGRIEEVVEKAKKEMENNIKEEGENALFDTGLHGIHPEIVRLLGRLRYRTSYGQNVLQ